MITKWLVSPSRFCVPASAADWPPKAHERREDALGPACYWGMPSISADDADFMVAGGTSGIYWRGENWSPQAFLVYVDYFRIPAANSLCNTCCSSFSNL